MVYIIGKRSNLSSVLQERMTDAVLVSTKSALGGDFILEKDSVIIFNNFQKATHLNDISNPSEYIANAIFSTAVVLEKLKNSAISKIIYSSSASVYGNNIYCKEQDQLQPLNLHSSLKVANEKLIEKFCDKNGIDFTITRVFNMYGGNDEFSVINKLLTCAKQHTEFTLINNGNAIRDFIHVDNVADVYEKLLSVKGMRYLNVASGNGISIGQMIDFLRLGGADIKTKVAYRDELKISTASTELLSAIANAESFKSVHDFISRAAFELVR